MDVWVPVACGLWLLQARPERPLAQGGVGRQVSGFPTTPTPNPCRLMRGCGGHRLLLRLLSRPGVSPKRR